MEQYPTLSRGKKFVVGLLFAVCGLFMLVLILGSFSSGGFRENFITNWNNSLSFKIFLLLVPFATAWLYRLITHRNKVIKISVILYGVIVGYLVLGGLLTGVGFCPEYFNFMPGMQSYPGAPYEQKTTLKDTIESLFCPLSERAY